MAWAAKWKKFSAMGRVVNDLFLPMKVPLRDSLNDNLPVDHRFCWRDVFQKHHNIGLIVDLTKTTRYYSPESITSDRIEYAKIFVEGHGSIPPHAQVKQFCDIVDAFLAKDSSRGRVVVVHCTHGLNRTGYMICKYLALRRNIPPDRTIQMFESARGEKMERAGYIADIMSTASPNDPNGSRRDTHRRPASSNGTHVPATAAAAPARFEPYRSLAPRNRHGPDVRNWRDRMPQSDLRGRIADQRSIRHSPQMGSRVHVSNRFDVLSRPDRHATNHPAHGSRRQRSPEAHQSKRDTRPRR